MMQERDYNYTIQVEMSLATIFILILCVTPHSFNNIPFSVIIIIITVLFAMHMYIISMPMDPLSGWLLVYFVVRTALLAMIGFMPSPGHGAIGSLDYTPAERKHLARRSVYSCRLFNNLHPLILFYK